MSSAQPEPKGKSLVLGVWDAISVRGLVFLWLCTMLATLLLKLTDPPNVVSGMVLGGVAMLAFVVIPKWNAAFEVRFLTLTLRAVKEEHPSRYVRWAELTDNLAFDVETYLDEHSEDVEAHIRGRHAASGAPVHKERPRRRSRRQDL